ncbi:hypothetical protein [Rhodoferax sp.]|uniref:hypothetical protein n=1 Tax=Rhodoferax sp. TaxID=50421 RepID=UPI002764BCA4|nr:hypothetical protein [Rhodoferax sp.]
MNQLQLIPFRAISSALPVQPRSVYQAHRRGTANFLVKKKIGDKEVGQWLFDPGAYLAHVLADGRQVARRTEEAIERALADQKEARR